MTRPALHNTGELARTTFSVLFIGVLLGAALWTLRPFLGPAIWATMVVVATWPLMRRVEKRLWGRRALAVIVMTLMLVLLFVVPLTLAIITIVDSADRIAGWARMLADFRVPDVPPAWLSHLPMVGSMIDRAWAQATAMGVRDLLPRLSPYAGNVTRWFVAEVGSVGALILQFLITVVISAVLYTSGEKAASMVRRFAARLGGVRGVAAVDLAGGAIRGVALGVGVTALVQALAAGLCLWLADVPFAGLLTALVFMLCIAQVGPLPVMLPAMGWAFYQGDTGWGIFLAVASAVIATMDNVIRPVLIRMGADLPLLLIFAGVIGGLFAFGLVGIFVGPVVLAVGFTLLESWIDDGDPPSDDAAPGP